jgi:hypothetical protein
MYVCCTFIAEDGGTSHVKAKADAGRERERERERER